MATGGSTHQALIAKNEYQIKLVTLVNECGDHLLSMLHDQSRGNMPRDEKKLYLALLPFRKHLKHLKKDQLEILFPKNKQTDSKLFDITILCDVLINCCPSIQAPIGGWRIKIPQLNDFSDGAEIIRVRSARNNVMHARALTVSQYNQLWNNIECILTRLGYNIAKIQDLKSGCLKDLELFKIKVIKAEIEIQKFDVEKNQDSIKQNQDDIKQNQESIKQKQVDIAQNKDHIIQNQADIKQNQCDIKQLQNELKTMLCAPEASQLNEIRKDLPSFTMFKNHRGNLVVQFDDDWSIQCVQISITKISAIIWKKLQENDDYIVRKDEGKLSLIIYNLNKDYVSDLSISLINLEQESQSVFIQDIYLVSAHNCTADRLNVITHNSGIISKEIETIVKTETEEADVEFICGGSRQRMTHVQYKRFERDYSHRFFTINDRCMEEPLQFPPPIFNETSSIFAQRIKHIMAKSKHRLFTIFTHYNSKEHIEFLKLDKQFSFKTVSDTNRILFFLPNTIINIRCTDATNLLSIQEEFEAGEEDIKALSVINKEYIGKVKLSMVNVVAAPNFKHTKDTNICVDCELLCNKIWSKDDSVLKFFSNIIQKVQLENSQDDDKEHYISMVSKIMCFMATRKALFSVPSLSDNINDQISSLILTTQQLRILYEKSKKKIVYGPLGSGKTILALSFLEFVYQISETKSVIYYVIWDDKTLLKQDVLSHVNNKFSNKANVTIVVRDVVELAKDLKMVKVPAPSQLLLSLVKKHADEKVHVIIDELNGELFDMQESSSLEHYLETENKVQDFIFVFFPQSVEKHRTFISRKFITEHNKYKYKETGMKVFKLNRAMRTPKMIFNFLKAFESKAADVKTAIKLPVQESRLKDVAVASLDGYDKEKVLTQPQQQQEPQLDQQLHQAITHTRAPIEEGESFEVPVDIDIVAASLNDEDLSEDVRTEIKWVFNSADIIGHNINGKKPLLIHPEIQQVTEEEVIPLLAFVLQDTCLQGVTKRLFLYNTLHQMTVFYKLLKLLKMDFFRYDDSTDWNILTSDNTIVNNLSHCATYNLLTTPQGSRGIEAAECVCVIDKDDYKLKHLTLEGMSRVTQNLILISTSNIRKANTLMSSTGHIISELLPGYLIECGIDRFEDDNNEIPFTKISSDNKIIFRINTQSWQYEEMIEDSKVIDCPNTTPNILSATEIVFNSLHPPKIVTNINCSYLSDTSCKLTWKKEGYRYNVKEQDNTDSVWILKASNITSNMCVVDNLVIDETYKFCVNASNLIGQSDDSIVFYHHFFPTIPGVTFADIAKLILNNDIFEMERLLFKYPNIVHIRDKHGSLSRGHRERTPLMWTAWKTDNSAMVEMLIEHGSDVWAESIFGRNSYHYAGMNNRYRVLDVLCRHDVTYINRGDFNNRTPFFRTAWFGNVECVNILLHYDSVDVTIRDTNGYNAYEVAGKYTNGHNRKIIRQLIKDYERKKESSILQSQ
ncbi:uncharacterized protein LOC130646944 isoform X2 [Hydractinia symbiolongicarpus]|nr:uncharacterized protein LOC130646944 isoform X2 [Hydractinia symbiolongicarpus]